MSERDGGEGDVQKLEPAPSPAPAEDAELIRAYLAARDARCPGCGYNLRGLEGGRCPECHEALELRVDLVEPRQGAFIAGLVGLAVGIGFSVAFLSGTALVAMRYGSMPGMVAEMWPLPLKLVLEGAALAAWVRGRRYLHRMPARGRATLAAACWGLSIALASFYYYNALSGV